MNTGTVTGGVVDGATDAYTPPAFGMPSLRKVVFKIAISDSRKGRHFWNCEAEGDKETLDRIIEKARPGAGVKIDFELAARPFMKRAGSSQVHAGEQRFLRVLAIEFPERAAHVPEPAEVSP